MAAILQASELSSVIQSALVLIHPSVIALGDRSEEQQQLGHAQWRSLPAIPVSTAISSESVLASFLAPLHISPTPVLARSLVFRAKVRPLSGSWNLYMKCPPSTHSTDLILDPKTSLYCLDILPHAQNERV
jgi:hypothetical protein